MLTVLTDFRSSMRTGLIVLLALGFIMGLAPVGLTKQPPSPAEPQPGERWIGRALQFIDTIARYIGKGIVYVVKVLMGDSLTPGVERRLEDLEIPIGYLAFITITLILFDTIAQLRRYIWWLLIIAWLLIVASIIIAALGPKEPTEEALRALMVGGVLAWKGPLARRHP